MSTLGERKCALLLSSLRQRDQRHLLSRLPTSSASRVRKLVSELTKLRLPLADLANELLADEVLGLTASTSIDLDQLLELSERLPAVWFARVLSSWATVDREFFLATLDRKIATDVRRELASVGKLPTKLIEALRAQGVSTLADGRKAA